MQGRTRDKLLLTHFFLRDANEMSSNRKGIQNKYIMKGRSIRERQLFDMADNFH
jgi:hypothetical protein